VTPPSSEYWLDRIALRLTRRDALKAMLGGAALALPLARTGSARAANPNACQQGCNWTTHQAYDSQVTTCGLQGLGAGLLAVGYAPLAGLSLFAVGGGAIALQLKVSYHCLDNAMLQQKMDQEQCREPGCPGFDAKAKGGPCDTCTASCCPDPAVVTGYSCCTLGCACNGDTGACHGSTTPC